MGVALENWLKDIWGIPFCCCEAAKDEIFGSLDDRQRPFLQIIAFIMEIICLPPMSGSIINPLESSIRILISNKLEDHGTMSGGPKGLGTSKIF